MITKKITKRIGATILAAAMMFGAVGDVKNVYAADEQNETVTETVTAYTIGQEMSGEIADGERIGRRVSPPIEPFVLPII